MVDESVLARVHLFGVLKALELLPEHDHIAREIAESTDLTIEFRVPAVGRARLQIGDGHIRLERESDRGETARLAGPDVVLACVSPKHFNAVIAGTRKPLPLKGFRLLRTVRKEFGELTDRLNHYLRSPNNGDHDSFDQATRTRLTAYVALHALSEIGNHDRVGQDLARRIPDGTIQFTVCSDIGLYVEVQDSRLRTVVGEHENPRCVLWFAELETLDSLLHGVLDTYRAIGSGTMGMRGFVPMVEQINPLFGRIPEYLRR